MDGSSLLAQDEVRYAVEKMPKFQKYFRLSQECSFKPLQLVYRFLLRRCRRRNMVEISYQC